MNHPLNPDNAQINYDIYGETYITLQQLLPNPDQKSFAFVSRQARKKDAPDGLKNLYKNYQKAQRSYAKAKRVYIEYRKTDDYPLYRTLRKHFHKISMKAFREKWNLKFHRNNLLKFSDA